MAVLEWNESYSVGVELIDDQHRQLFEACGRFERAIESSQETALTTLLDTLLDYSRSHFATEEGYFEQFDYEETESHKEQHAAFINIVQGYKARFDSDDLIVPNEILYFLERWLKEHVTSSDSRYAACFQKNGLK